MKVLVFSHQHGLLPWAWRLKRDGHDLTTLVWSDRYEAAWDGRLPKITGSPKEKIAALQPLIDEAQRGELTVLTDSPRGQELFADAPQLFGIVQAASWPAPPKLGLLGWFDGESWSGERWIIPDWGLWPGGLGAQVMGGCVVVGGAHYPPVLNAFTDALKSVSFKGLVMVGLDWLEAANELVPTGCVAGWPALATHAYMCSLENLGDVLTGDSPQHHNKPYTTALPVSQLPYPVAGAPGPEPVSLAGLVSEAAKQCFFHDVQVRGNEVWTAGLNGLVCVVAASGGTLFTSQQKAMAVAQALPLREKQYRVDVGAAAHPMLSGLETLGYL